MPARTYSTDVYLTCPLPRLRRPQGPHHAAQVPQPLTATLASP